MRRYLVTLILLALSLPRIAPAEQAGGGQTLEQVQEMIQKQGLHWTARHTSMSDVPWEELRSRLTFRIPPDYASIPKVDMSRRLAKSQPLPSHWDWREHDGVTPVKNQGQCGSCWAFASAGALEGCALVGEDVVYDLSEQEILSCNSTGNGCNGGWWDASFDVFNRVGAVDEACMPYEARDGVRCLGDQCPIVLRADSLIWLEPSIESIKAALLTYGPVAVGIAVLSDFSHYGGGCYNNPTPTTEADVNHAVVIVGWDDSSCGGAWIVKNSWGTGWGDAGFFTIAYGCCMIGYGPVIFHPVLTNTVLIASNAPPNTTLGGREFPIEAQVESRSSSPINPDSVVLSYRVNGSPWRQQTMRLKEESGVYEGTIPAVEKPASVDYTITASDLRHRRGRAPREGAQAVYSFDLAREWEDFEGDHPGWMVGDAQDNAVSGVWDCVVPIGTEAQPGTNHTPTGSKCWVTGQGLPGGDNGDSDVDGGRTTLLSPLYDLSATRTAIVKYWRWFSNDRGMNPGSDPWIVQVRKLGGDWVDLENRIFSTDGWSQFTADLHPYLGRELGFVQFRFIATDNDPPSCVEAALDDFEILGEEREVCRQDPRILAMPEPLAASPNPLQRGMELRIATGGPAPSVLTVFDAVGRQVRRIRTATASSARQEVVWDGRDETGRSVPSGVYFYVLGNRADLGQGRVIVVH